MSRPRHFSGRLKSVATELSLSRQGLADWCRNKTRLMGSVTMEDVALGDKAPDARATAHDNVLNAHDRPMTVHSVVHCLGNRSRKLFMGIVKKKKKKKEY